MKILIDAIHTNDPMRCSMNYKLQIMIKEICKKRNDVFFYYIVPENYIGSEHWETNDMPVLPNTKYISVPTSRQRMIEYYRIDPKFDKLFKFYGKYWDWDILLSARVPMFTQMYFLGNGKLDIRKIVGIEDMPILSFKGFVSFFNKRIQDLSTITGYLTADCVYNFSYWEKAELLKIAKEQFSSSNLKYLIKNFHNTSPVVIDGIKLKTKKQLKERDTKQFFNIGYTMRFETGRRNIENVMTVFEKIHVLKGKRAKLFVTSNSRSFKGFKSSHPFVEFLRATRKQFWDYIQNVFDVVLVMSLEEDYSLSMMEPIINGVPVIILRRLYSEVMLTDEYPFFVNNWKEAYVMIVKFQKNYDEMYEKFSSWSKDYNVLLKERNKIFFPDMFSKYIDDFSLLKNVPKRIKGNFVDGVIEYIEKNGYTDFILEDVMVKMEKEGMFKHLSISEKSQERKFLFFKMDYNQVRRHLLNLNFKDGIEVGRMIKC